MPSEQVGKLSDRLSVITAKTTSKKAALNLICS
jgi:hypothetical protein